MKQSFKQIVSPILSILIGFIFSMILVALVGESPWSFMKVLVVGAFGSATQFGYTLYYATPFMFTGLGIAWALKSGLFNVGAEGQMSVGGLMMISTGLFCQSRSIEPELGLPLIIFAGFLGGGVWGGIAGFLKAYRGCHEVLATILMNFLAYGVTGYVILEIFRNPIVQNPETLPLPMDYRYTNLWSLGGTSPLNTSFLIGVLLCLIFFGALFYFVVGFRHRMVGESPGVARCSGVNTKLYTMAALFFSGGLAGLAGMNDLLGYSLKLKEGFTGGAGFAGIAVALVARNHPLMIIPSSIFFGALHQGAMALDIEMSLINRDISYVIQALIILFLVIEPGVMNLVKYVFDRKALRG